MANVFIYHVISHSLQTRPSGTKRSLFMICTRTPISPQEKSRKSVTPDVVMPAHGGIQRGGAQTGNTSPQCVLWIPAFAGMTLRERRQGRTRRFHEKNFGSHQDFAVARPHWPQAHDRSHGRRRCRVRRATAARFAARDRPFVRRREPRLEPATSRGQSRGRGAGVLGVLRKGARRRATRWQGGGDYSRGFVRCGPRSAEGSRARGKFRGRLHGRHQGGRVRHQTSRARSRGHGSASRSIPMEGPTATCSRRGSMDSI